MSHSALTLSVVLENNALSYDSVHTAWGMLNLQHTFPDISHQDDIAADFVLALDVSASVDPDAKISFLQQAMSFVLSQLGENQTISVICFNQEAEVYSELKGCTPENRRILMSRISKVGLSGSTNLSAAISTGIDILNKRSQTAQGRISSIMIITEWGFGPKESCSWTPENLLPQGCVVHTFGFGKDHDSKSLHSLALKSQGGYYFLNSIQDISQNIGSCIQSILATRAHQVEIRLVAQDGARIVAIATPYKINEVQTAKDYNIKVALVSQGESKSILFRLSLRSMKSIVNSHHLLNAEINYINSVTGQHQLLMANLSVIRPAIQVKENMPLALDQQINRYSTATIINECVQLAAKMEFMLARLKINNMIEQIRKSVSGSTNFCTLLISDLISCASLMNENAFANGVHYAYKFSSTHFLEKNTTSLERTLDPLCRLDDGYQQVVGTKDVPWNRVAPKTPVPRSRDLRCTA